MARAYICVTRNDLGQGALQTLDLISNVSQRNSIYDPIGQTGYLSFAAQHDTVATAGAGPKTATADFYGLAAYLIDNVALHAGGAITAANANTIASALLVNMAAGAAMTSAAINVTIQLTCAGSGIGLDTSTATVEQILKIMAGAVYKLPSGSVVEDGANAFVATVSGFFVTAPTLVASTVRGRRPSTPITTAVPAQTGTHDVNYRNVRVVINTPDLHRSCLNGALSKLKSATYAFTNPAFTYGAAGTAKLADGATHIGVSHVAAAVAVYAADGTVI